MDDAAMKQERVSLDLQCALASAEAKVHLQWTINDV